MAQAAGAIAFVNGQTAHAHVALAVARDGALGTAIGTILIRAIWVVAIGAHGGKEERCRYGDDQENPPMMHGCAWRVTTRWEDLGGV